MKTIFLFALLALAAADDAVYDLEKIDIATLNADIGEFKKFVDCFVDKGPCSELYLSYKDVTSEAIKEACKKCSTEVKQFGSKFFEILKTQLPEDYVLFKQVYDPENKYLEVMETELNKYKTV